MTAWEDIPEHQRPFQTRLMEVAARVRRARRCPGRAAGRRDRPAGLRRDTMVFYIWGDNGSSGEGLDGTISELLAQYGIPTTVDMHIKALDELGLPVEVSGRSCTI